MKPSLDKRFAEVVEVCRQAGEMADLPGTMAVSWTGDGFECSWAASLSQGTAVGEVTVCFSARLEQPSDVTIVSRLTRKSGEPWLSPFPFHPLHPSMDAQLWGKRLPDALAAAWKSVLQAEGKMEETSLAHARTNAVAELQTMAKRRKTG